MQPRLSWERAEPWQTCCTEAAGRDAQPWSCSSSPSLSGTAGQQPSCCLLQVQGQLGCRFIT